MTNISINLNEIPKQIISINLPIRQKYTALKPLFTAAFKAGCYHFNIKYNNSGNDQNIIEFVKLINEWGNKEFINENQPSPRENKNIFLSLTLIINNNLNETLSTDIEELLNQPNLHFRPNLILLKINNLNNNLYKQPKKKAKIEENNKNIIINIRSSIRRKDNYLAKNYPLKLWNSLEKYLTSGNLKNFGICGIDLDKIENVYNGALIKPKYWQITLNQLLEYFEEIKNLANKLNLLIIVDTTGGVGECKINGTMRINLLRDLSKKYERTASQVLHRWLQQHGMIIQRNCGTLNYLNISRQISISDIEISDEDMNILNDLYKRKAQEQIKR
uniref:NADP-dependent oxidoreductase domain-containing protein n=1 Tax=Meloidogyne enterolobii TaxID=390850 RepID=A0A6V7USN6_MELEN|nr:unnamed protein product [Meloidogyne enterolobii]